MEATPTENTLPLRYGDFSTLADALDYAAQGETGPIFTMVKANSKPCCRMRCCVMKLWTSPGS